MIPHPGLFLPNSLYIHLLLRLHLTTTAPYYYVLLRHLHYQLHRQLSPQFLGKLGRSHPAAVIIHSVPHSTPIIARMGFLGHHTSGSLSVAH